jgi:hypothetical protein
MSNFLDALNHFKRIKRKMSVALEEAIDQLPTSLPVRASIPSFFNLFLISDPLDV